MLVRTKSQTHKRLAVIFPNILKYLHDQNIASNITITQPKKYIPYWFLNQNIANSHKQGSITIQINIKLTSQKHKHG